MTAAPGGPGQPYKSDPSDQGQYQGQYGQGQYQQGQYSQPQGQYGPPQGAAPAYSQYPGTGPAGSGNRGALMVLGIVAILAGAAAAIGSFLDWVSISIPTALAQGGCATISVSPMGSATACGQTVELPTNSAIDPWLTLAGGILAVVGGLIAIAARGARQAGGSLAVLGGVLAAGFGLYNMISAGDDIKEGIAGAGGNASAIEVSPAIGLWLVVVGGVLALIAGIAVLAKKD